MERRPNQVVGQRKRRASTPRRDRPKQRSPQRLSLVSPITPRGRRVASTKVVVRGNTYKVRRSARPARIPNKAVPTRQQAPVTARQVTGRQERHGRRLEAHRGRVAAKKRTEALQRRVLFHRAGEPLPPPGHVDARLARPTPRSSSWLVGRAPGEPVPHGKPITAFIGRLIDRWAEAKLDTKGPNETIKAALHPRQSISGAIRARNELDLGNTTNPGRSLNAPNKLFIQTPRALVEHPGAIPKTIKGIAEVPLAAPAGILKGVTDPVGTGKQIVKDYKHRYGQSNKEFRDRIGREGAAPEILDAAGLTGVQGSLFGRGLTRTVKAAAPEAPLAKLVTGKRPKLRTTGGVAHEQNLSPNAFRAVAQRAEDAARARKTRRRNERHPDEKPGLQPDRGEVVPLFERRAQRVEASKVQSRRFQRFSNERAKEIDRGVMRGLGRLNRHQRRAVGIPAQGIVPLTDPAGAVAGLMRRRTRIVEAYQKAGHKGEPREAREIDYLIEHADQVFNDDLAKFHQAEVERHGRIGHMGVNDLTAEVRRHRPQAEELGIAYPYERARDAIEKRYQRNVKRASDANDAAKVRQMRDTALKDLEQRKPEIDRQFVTDVRREAQAAGLPEPVYLQHFKHRIETKGRSAFALGGTRAAAAPKRTDMALYRTGRADVSAQAYVQSTARTIKRRHNWGLIAETADTHQFPLPSEHELRDALGHKHARPEEMTADHWRTLLEHRHVDLADYALWSPGRFQREVTGHAAGDHQLHPGREEDLDVREVQTAAADSIVPANEVPEGFTQESGVRLIPREVYDEIHSAIRGSNVGGRLLDRLQAFQSRVLLGTNPSWEGIQIAANAFVSAVGTRGNLADFVKAPVFYRRLPPEVREAADELFGTGVGESHGRKVHLGAATNSRMIESYRAMREALRFKSASARNAVPVLRGLPSGNPIDLMFALDNVQNRYFKRVVLYNNAKRQAFRDMAEHGGQAYRLQEQVANLLSLDPRGRVEAMISDPQTLIKHAEAVNNVLGDYVRYTARERRTLKRYVLFYGFMRYSLRTLFYTLPVKHPLVAAAGAKLAQLQVQEVEELLGGDQTPWAFSKLFTSTKKGALKSIDLARLNPVANPLVSVSTEGVKGLTGFFSPAFQIGMDQLYGTNAFTGRQFRVDGSAEETGQPGTEERFRIMANEALSLSFPYRAASKATQPETQGDDTLLWDPRPIEYKSPEARRKEKLRRAQAGSAGQVLLSQIVPFIPRPDHSDVSAASIRAHDQPKRKRRKKAGGGYGAGSGGGSGSSGYAAGGGRTSGSGGYAAGR